MKLGHNVSKQLEQLGIPQQVMVGGLANLDQASLNRLTHLGTGFDHVAALAPTSNKFGRNVKDGRRSMAPPWANLSPSEAQELRAAFISGSYAQGGTSRTHPSADQPMDAMFNRHRRRGAAMVRRLHEDELLRAAFEKGTQLQMVPDGRTDGAVSVSAMTSSSGSRSLFDVLHEMDQVIMREAGKIANYQGDNSGFFSNPANVGMAFGLGSTEEVANGGPAQPQDNDTSDNGSVDLMTMELKRLLDKKTQAYELARAVFDKSNEAAKTAINNMRA